MRFVRWCVLSGLAAGFGFIACGGVSSEGVFSDGGATSLDAASSSEGDSSSGGDGSAGNDGATSGDGAAVGDAGSADAGPKDAGKKDAAPFDAGAKKDGGGVCTVNCHSDLECEQTCPTPPQGSSNCCDFTTGVCYASLSGICPH